MIATLSRLIPLAGISRRRAALAVLLGSLAVGFGIALAAATRAPISRAAERPPILSLTVAIVAVRFFGLARPLARYLDRLASHDVALRCSAGDPRRRLPAEAAGACGSRATGAASCWPGWWRTSTHSRASTPGRSARRSSRSSSAAPAYLAWPVFRSRWPRSSSPPDCSPAASRSPRSR